MIEALAALLAMALVSDVDDDSAAELQKQLGLVPRDRIVFYVLFTRSWQADVGQIFRTAIGRDRFLHKGGVITGQIATDLLMREPGKPLIRRAIHQLRTEITSPGSYGFDWRKYLNATFEFLDGWSGDVDEIGGDTYHLAAKISVDAPSKHPRYQFPPLPDEIREQRPHFYPSSHPKWGEDYSKPMQWMKHLLLNLYVDEDINPWGEFDILGYDLEGSPSWVPLSDEDIAAIEALDMLGDGVVRDPELPLYVWALHHRMMWDDIEEHSQGRLAPIPPRLDVEV